VEATTFDIGEGRVVRITCSVGYACYPFVRSEPELYGWEDMLGLADAALYTAKDAAQRLGRVPEHLGSAPRATCAGDPRRSRSACWRRAPCASSRRTPSWPGPRRLRGRAAACCAQAAI
jgi:GGDEF domain-containing protein